MFFCFNWIQFEADKRLLRLIRTKIAILFVTISQHSWRLAAADLHISRLCGVMCSCALPQEQCREGPIPLKIKIPSMFPPSYSGVIICCRPIPASNDTIPTQAHLFWPERWSNRGQISRRPSEREGSVFLYLFLFFPINYFFIYCLSMISDKKSSVYSNFFFNCQPCRLSPRVNLVSCLLMHYYQW